MPIKIFSKIIGSLVIVLGLFAGCHKKDIPPQTKTDILINAPWKFTQAGLDTNKDGAIDTPLRPDLLPTCAFDNMYIFKADSTGSLDENLVNCNGSNQLVPFNWYFFNNETEFFMSVRIIPIYEGNSKIIELTNRRFVISKQVGVHGFPDYLTVVIVLSR